MVFSYQTDGALQPARGKPQSSMFVFTYTYSTAARIKITAAQLQRFTDALNLLRVKCQSSRVNSNSVFYLQHFCCSSAAAAAAAR
jgi:hypothetical protein